MPGFVLLFTKLELTAWSCIIMQLQNLVGDLKTEGEPPKKLWEVRVPHVRPRLMVLAVKGASQHVLPLLRLLSA